MAETISLPKRKSRWTAIRSGVPAVLVLGGILGYFLMKSGGPSGASDRLVREVVDSEELILELSPRLGALSRGLMNLELPGAPERENLFAKVVAVTDIGDQAGPVEARGKVVTERRLPPAEMAREVPRGDLSLWRTRLATVDYFEHAKFKFVRGEFVGGGRDRFESLVKFGGVLREKAGGWTSLSANQWVTWESESGDGWRIVSWRMGEMTAKSSGRRLFT